MNLRSPMLYIAPWECSSHCTQAEVQTSHHRAHTNVQAIYHDPLHTASLTAPGCVITITPNSSKYSYSLFRLTEYVSVILNYSYFMNY